MNIFFQAQYFVLYTVVSVPITVKYTKQDYCLWNFNKMKRRQGIGREIKITP
jgi:hypothetical protein